MRSEYSGEDRDPLKNDLALRLQVNRPPWSSSTGASGCGLEYGGSRASRRPIDVIPDPGNRIRFVRLQPGRQLVRQSWDVEPDLVQRGAGRDVQGAAVLVAEGEVGDAGGDVGEGADGLPSAV